MEPKFRTSFIPKQPIVATSQRNTRRGPSFFLLIALILFLATVLLSGGVFLYRAYLKDSVVRKSESLERARAAFEPALIQELTRLDGRIAAAGGLLRGHLAPSALFALLEQNTLEHVRFKNFKYTVAPDRISIAMKGEATSFAAVALQSDAFGRTRAMRDPIFSNLNLDQKGNVVFDFSAFVDPSVLSYSRTLSSRPPAGQQGGTPAGASTSTPPNTP